MRKIYSKDDAAPDALPATQWLSNNLGMSEETLAAMFRDNSIKIDYQDEMVRVTFFAGVIYVIIYSCGVNEDVYIASQQTLAELVSKYSEVLSKS